MLSLSDCISCSGHENWAWACGQFLVVLGCSCDRWGGSKWAKADLLYVEKRDKMFAVAPLREEGKLWTSVTECQNITLKSLVSFNSSLEGL